MRGRKTGVDSPADCHSAHRDTPGYREGTRQTPLARRNLSKVRCALLLFFFALGAACTQLAHAGAGERSNRSLPRQRAAGPPVAGAPLPTVVLPARTAVRVPTLTLPRPTPKPRPTPTKVRRQPAPARMQWVWAYLTSYCPAT